MPARSKSGYHGLLSRRPCPLLLFPQGSELGEKFLCLWPRICGPSVFIPLGYILQRSTDENENLGFMAMTKIALFSSATRFFKYVHLDTHSENHAQ